MEIKIKRDECIYFALYLLLLKKKIKMIEYEILSIIWRIKGDYLLCTSCKVVIKIKNIFIFTLNLSQLRLKQFNFKFNFLFFIYHISISYINQRIHKVSILTNPHKS